MSTDFRTAAKAIYDQLDDLASRAVGNYKRAVTVFTERDGTGAADVIETAEEISADIVKFEDAITTTLALYQPVAVDLRQIMRSFKLAHDFEKIASLSARIAKKTRKLSLLGEINIPAEFQANMSKVAWLIDACQQITHDMDDDLAGQIKIKTEELHQFKSAIKRQIENEISTHPENAKALMGMLGISRNLVRIADVTSDVATELGSDR